MVVKVYPEGQQCLIDVFGVVTDTVRSTVYCKSLIFCGFPHERYFVGI